MKRKIISILIIGLLCFTIFPLTSATNTQSKQEEKSRTSEETIPIYYANVLVEYSKDSLGLKTLYLHVHGDFQSRFVEIPAKKSNLNLMIIMNFTAGMNFGNGISFVPLAPIIAFGMKIENYSDYVWKSMKFNHTGNASQEGNISIPISINMENVKPGDKMLIKPTIAIVGDPFVYSSKDLAFSKYTSYFLRFVYSISPDNPLLNKVIFPFIAEHNQRGEYESDFTKIYVLFQ